jgi:hypothetical protein
LEGSAWADGVEGDEPFGFDAGEPVGDVGEVGGELGVFYGIFGHQAWWHGLKRLSGVRGMAEFIGGRAPVVVAGGTV